MGVAAVNGASGAGCPAMYMYVVRMVLWMLVLAAVGGGVLYLARRYSAVFPRPSKGRRMRIVEVTSLGLGCYLVLVQVDDKMVLLGYGRQGLSTLGEFPTGEDEGKGEDTGG